MDKKSKIFFIIFSLLIVGSVSLAYYKLMIKRDYVTENQVDCDPTVEKCFVWKCDPNATDESEKCTGDPEKDIWYYQLAKRNTSRIPLCDPNKDEKCEPMKCDSTAEEDCSITFCDDKKNKVEQNAECNDPVQYNIDNPPEEEVAACEEGDTECEAAAAEETTCAEGDEACASQDSSGSAEDTQSTDQSE